MQARKRIVSLYLGNKSQRKIKREIGAAAGT